MGETVWRGYDREALDEQLNLRARTPEHVDFFARWAEESAAVRQSFVGYRELAFGAVPGATLDFFPAPEPQAPLFAFIHGGYWQSLDKSDYSWPAPTLTRLGLAYASLNYTLAPAGTIGQMIEEVRHALAFLYREAGRLGYDPERITVAGHSAGGHLAAMAAITDWREVGARLGVSLPDDLLKGALCISGVYDLEAIRHSYHQPIVKLSEADAAAWSPIHHLPESAPPLYLSVGGDEPQEFHDQQADFAAACKAKGLSCETVEAPGLHHFSIVDKMTEAGHPLYEALTAMAEGKGG
jgi:arylformamidase